MKIAYLAPEIPALSATFVYNEILALEALGHTIFPVSVHYPHSLAGEPKLVALKARTRYLYDEPLKYVFFDHINLLFSKPLSYLKALKWLVLDIFSEKVFKRGSLGLGYRFFFAARLAQLILNNKIVHLHVHFAHVPTDLAMYACAMSNIQYSVTAHANDIFERGWLLKTKVTRSKFFATISEYNKRYLLSQYQVDPKKLKIIRCGVDSRTFQRRERPLEKERIFKIGVVGRLIEKKGIDCLIKAFGALTKQKFLSKPMLYIAGSGPLEQDLKALASQQSRDEQEQVIHFLGALPHDQVATFVGTLDLFVLPCKPDSNGDMDGIPVVLMEAMMSGVPIISTTLSGIPELVINNKTGITVAPDSVDQLTEAIKLLIDNNDLSSELAHNARHRVLEEFDLFENADRLISLITE